MLLVEGHFVTEFLELDDRGYPVRFETLRLLPTAFGPGRDLEYASCAGMADWSEYPTRLVWEEEDLASSG